MAQCIADLFGVWCQFTLFSRCTSVFAVILLMLSQEERMENMRRIRILSSGNSMLYFCTWLYLEGVGRFMPKSKHFPCWISSDLPNSLKRYRGSRSSGLCLTGELEVGMQNSIRNKLYRTSGHVIPTESIMVFIREVPQILSRAGSPGSFRLFPSVNAFNTGARNDAQIANLCQL